MEAIITKLAGSLIAGIKVAAGFILARAMAAVGVSWASFEYAMPVVMDWVVAKASMLPGPAVQLLSAVGLDIAITLVVSAYVARYGLELMLVGAGKLEQMIARAGG